jgi:hypothetical protein
MNSFPPNTHFSYPFALQARDASSGNSVRWFHGHKWLAAWTDRLNSPTGVFACKTATAVIPVWMTFASD